MTSPSPLTVDVAIVGAGVAGTSATTLLARAGIETALIDPRPAHPDEFRAEKLVQSQMDIVDRIGLGPTVRAATTRADEMWVARFGRVIQQIAAQEYGFAYGDLANALRRGLPDRVHMIQGRVASLETNEDRQRVHLPDGRLVEARLVILATGQGATLHRQLDIRRAVRSPAHSLSVGFDFSVPARSSPFPALTYYAEHFGRRLAHMTVFPIGETMRGNIFAYPDVSDDWPRAFRKAPDDTLRLLFPGFCRLYPAWGIASPVDLRPVDLLVPEGHRRPGVALIGDAFSIVCPVPGDGLTKVFTDVERLCLTHIPAWLASPGMGAAKIGAFYDDPVKRKVDEDAMARSEFGREFATNGRLGWSLRRARGAVRVLLRENGSRIAALAGRTRQPAAAE